MTRKPQLTKHTALEIFKDIPLYEDYYQVSNLGSVLSLHRMVLRKNGVYRTQKQRILKIRVNNRGYICVVLSKCGITKNMSVHRLVADAFIPNPENKATVNHKNGIKHDNRLENLEWMTQAQNNIHAIESGLRVKCDKPILQYTLNGNFIRKWKSGTEAYKSIGVSNSNISQCCKYKIKNAGKFIWRYA